jgi:hypothetical protein
MAARALIELHPGKHLVRIGESVQPNANLPPGAAQNQVLGNAWIPVEALHPTIGARGQA